MNNPKEVIIEDHFCTMVARYSGITRKVAWVHRAGAPDRLAMFPGTPGFWVELKRPKNGRLSTRQKREHKAMRDHGQIVVVLWTIEEINQWFVETLGNHHDLL